MGWLDDLARSIETAVEVTITDAEKIIDRVFVEDETDG